MHVSNTVFAVLAGQLFTVRDLFVSIQLLLVVNDFFMWLSVDYFIRRINTSPIIIIPNRRFYL